MSDALKTPVFAIKHKPSGKWLHIRKFDDKDQVLMTSDLSESWVSFKEQAVAQAVQQRFFGQGGVAALLEVVQHADGLAIALAGLVLRVRLYLGAGTSGRLGLLDSVELLPTFSWPPERALALIAGGRQALTHRPQPSHSASSTTYS